MADYTERKSIRKEPPTKATRLDCKGRFKRSVGVLCKTDTTRTPLTSENETGDRAEMVSSTGAGALSEPS